MALVLFNDGYSDNVGTITMNGSWTGGGEGFSYRFQWGYGSYSNSTSYVPSDDESGSYDRTPTVDKDRTIKFRPQSGGGTLGPGSGDFKTYADAATFPSGLTPGTPTTTTCPVTGSVMPKTTESSGDVYMEYRVKGTSPWLTNGGAIAVGLNGSGTTALGGTLTGLAPGTIYEARYRIDRNTANSGTSYSAMGTFTTQSTADVVIAPAVMLATAQMFTPTLIFGAGAVIVSPAVMEMEAEMFVPALVFSQEVVVEKFVTFNNGIERSVKVG